ncbi:MAG TPA: SH3 domain-containing protein [Azoarcus sp.]|nr:SH3 domain-containing protein [Azoarcus sp.]
MKLRHRLFGLFALLILAPVASGAGVEFRSINETSILYATPSDQARKLYIIKRGTPVEIVVVIDNWAKVRDSNGALSWIEERRMSPARTVMVTAEPVAEIRSAPEEAAAKVFDAATYVILELVTPPDDGWVEVKHENGTGYVRINQIWGV